MGSSISKRIEFAELALKGISIGDAFGESFFGPREQIEGYISNQSVPESSWEFTDDTVMGIAVLKQLIKNQGIDQDELCQEFADNHNKDVNRGYGATVRSILRGISEGASWRILSKEAFDGMGSMGNGASMRVGPIGAYYYDDLKAVKSLAAKSAEVTHSNPEAICGAISIAVGTAIATQIRLDILKLSPIEFLEMVVAELPDSDTKSKIAKSITVPYSYRIDTVRTILGDGSKMTAQDTVPFCLWCSAYNLANFENALWKAVSMLGDRDTICAIVGAITIMSATKNSVPAEWLDSVEDYRSSKFY